MLHSRTVWKYSAEQQHQQPQVPFKDVRHWYQTWITFDKSDSMTFHLVMQTLNLSDSRQHRAVKLCSCLHCTVMFLDCDLRIVLKVFHRLYAINQKKAYQFTLILKIVNIFVEGHRQIYFKLVARPALTWCWYMMIVWLLIKGKLVCQCQASNA